ncbi:hypothetical protein C8J57DRAFT_1537314 [Mycena rebaudengoi]|nr:hypothetical protein C8J57DRAFT_1537314 [Mycena rebaudengoi]
MPRGGGKGKRKVSEDLQEQHIPFDNPAVKRVHFTTTSNSGIHQATTVQNRLPIVRTIPPAAATSGNSGTSQRNETVAGTPPPSPTSSALPKKPAQNSQLLDDYADNFQLLGDLLLEHEADVAIGETCSCTADPPRRRSVQCHDCTAYAATCEPCFVTAHLNNPFTGPRFGTMTVDSLFVMIYLSWGTLSNLVTMDSLARPQPLNACLPSSITIGYILLG